MGLFDFLKKDKNNKNGDEINKLDNKSETKNSSKSNSQSKSKQSKGLFTKKSTPKEDINPFDKPKITEESFKLAKEERLKKDVRTEDEKLKDEVMKDIAFNHSNRNNRIAGTMELVSQDILEEISFKHKDKFVRTVAVSRITDPDILEEISSLANYSDVRQIAFEKLDQLDLAFGELAKFEKDKKVSYSAIEKIENEYVLADVVLYARDKKIKYKALEKIEKLNINYKFNIRSDSVTIGSVFWFRQKSLKQLINYDFKYSDFSSEPMPHDFALAHTLERIAALVL